MCLRWIWFYHYVWNESAAPVTGINDITGLKNFDARDSGSMPAVILLDLKFSKIDGLEVLKQIRAREATRLLPVVI